MHGHLSEQLFRAVGGYVAYHGVLAPNHRWRGEVTPAKHGKEPKMGANAEVKTPAECHAAMTWAQRLKRVFNIDIEVCGRCGGYARGPTAWLLGMHSRLPPPGPCGAREGLVSVVHLVSLEHNNTRPSPQPPRCGR